MFENKSSREVCAQLQTDMEKGLSEAEAERRYQSNGGNELKGKRKKTLLESFLEQLNDPLIYVLIAAAVISVLLHEISDAVIILVVVLLNSVVGMVQEGKAQKALDSLKKLASPKAYVIRDGKEQEIPARELVEGDLVCLEAGCQVPADLRLTSTKSLKIEESALTGESLPIEKESEFLAKTVWDKDGNVMEIPLGDRRNMAYMSTVVTYGRGQGIVTATGMDTQIGKIATLINESQEDMTPLQKRLGELGKLLSILSLLLCAALFFIAILQHRNLFDMLLTAISLAVAAVPEGLPAVVTICLALSVTRMVKVNTIIRKLPSVETLGAVSVVCSDKTGTLTQNRMTVTDCYYNQRLHERQEMDSAKQKEFLEGMVLCNDAVVEEGSRIGDPTELALLDLAADSGIYRTELEKRMPRLKEIAFDSNRKMMSTFHQKGSGRVTYTKGAPDEILKRCSGILLYGKVEELSQSRLRQIRAAIADMSSRALRTLAVAMRQGGDGPKEENLIFLGMVGMKDPARPEAAGAVERFRQAGVKTVMITGDHVDTAYAIGKQLGIADSKEECMTGEEIQTMSDQQFEKRAKSVRVFARVSPEHKVRIVKAFQAQDNIVAMTGDGVNDAPSLKTADIGIAMGMNGTDVAKQASDMILTDDNFATIEKAIKEGRGVYENIRKSVIFLLSSNLGEIMTMFLAVICGFASPLKSSHILWINLITDSLPALALGVDENDGERLMSCPPRKAKESLFAGGRLLCTCFYGSLIAAVSLTAFFSLPFMVLTAKGIPVTLQTLAAILQQEEVLMRAQTYAFTVLGMSQLFHAVGMRDMTKSIFKMNHFNNKLMIGACIIGFLLQFAVTKVPFFIQAFGTVSLSGQEWLRLSILSAFPLLAHEVMALLVFRETKKESTQQKRNVYSPYEVSREG